MAKRIDDDDGAAALGESDRDHEGKLANIGARRANIRSVFNKLCAWDDDIAAAMETYVKPLKKERAKAWKNLCADVDMKGEDLKPWYMSHRRHWLARDFENEDEMQKVYDDNREIALAMAPGTITPDWQAVFAGTVEDIVEIEDDEADEETAEPTEAEVAEKAKADKAAKAKAGDEATVH